MILTFDSTDQVYISPSPNNSIRKPGHSRSRDISQEKYIFRKTTIVLPICFENNCLDGFNPEYVQNRPFLGSDHLKDHILHINPFNYGIAVIQSVSQNIETLISNIENTINNARRKRDPASIEFHQ
jgi:hypothetical protein